MIQKVKIVEDNKVSYAPKFKVGDRTIKLVDSLKIDDEAKITLIDEALHILSSCIPPGVNDNITNIAIGYVQSGKTMSFTTLTALAADNNYRIIVYFTGTKTNLQQQTYSRLQNDLQIKQNTADYKMFNIGTKIQSSEINRIKNFLLMDKQVLLFPILKHYKHIGTLATIFNDPALKPIITNKGVLIIDDEADQSSFNTYARKNASNMDDWAVDEFSKTYESIISLRSGLPCHSYVQYTATPQAAFLINNNDILSPKFHTVLTPGKEYTGGKFFFKNEELDLIRIIPEEEIYHYKRNPLESCPKSLKTSLKEFLISVAIVVLIQKRKDFLSMMIHADGLQVTNEKFFNWTNDNIQKWIDLLLSPDSDPAKPFFIDELKGSYNSISQYIENCPSFNETLEHLPTAMMSAKLHLVQSGINSDDTLIAENAIEWDSDLAHILVGADMLNRGFTVENLSMTYLCRSTKGRSNADTIEQRCRFFGYKRKYADVCRVYLGSKNFTEYVDYVEHEEIMRTSLKSCSSIKEFSQQAKAMILAGSLNPTRSNILSKKLVRDKLYGWRQMLSLKCMAENKKTIETFIEENHTNFTLFHDFNNPMRNHRYMKISIDDFLTLFSSIKYEDVPNITRKIVTIQYLQYLKETNKLEYVYLFEMSYAAEPRKRKIVDGKPQELFMGYARNGSYPGDKEIKFDDSLCVQVHHLISDDISVIYGNKDFYNFAIHYPENEEYITFESDDYEEYYE